MCCSAYEHWVLPIFSSFFRYDALCCSVLLRVAACCSMLQLLQCAAVSCSVLQCLAVCRSVLQCVQCVAACCSVLQCAAVSCSVLQCVQCVAVCCSVLQYVAVCLPEMLVHRQTIMRKYTHTRVHSLSHTYTSKTCMCVCTHCNKLQHTPEGEGVNWEHLSVRTHCNTLQHTATHCSSL